MPIRLLSPEVVGKIAAGEVVERPASVVKELVENSLDAGATSIRVEIREGGRRLIRVADDGCGIPETEAPLAFARHATSKLSSAADLEHISTLGFRGEALASIAAVSQVTLLTRPRDQAAGTWLRADDGQVVHQETRGCPAGTIITVEHLFHNVPARQKFLRQPTTEAGHVFSALSNYALANPEVRFSLEVDGRQTLRSAGNGSRHDVLIAVYGLETVEQMLEIEGSMHDGRDPMVSGHVSMPALHRANRTYLAFFVNRRWIQDRSLAHAVIQAYHTLLPVGRYPIAVLFLELDPGDVDVNVHPTKREVRFRDAHTVFSAVQRSVRRTLIAGSTVPSLAGTHRTWPTIDWEPTRHSLPAHQAQFVDGQSRLERPGVLAQGEGGEAIGPVRLPLLRVVGQVGQTYIVAEGPQGLYLIDQHAAHERVLYEQMRAAHGEQASSSQVLLEPVLLELDPPLAGVLAEHLLALVQVGFGLEPFGGSTFLVRAVPAILTTTDVASAISDILELLREGEAPTVMQEDERLMAAVCKRAAVKAGQTLSHEEMQQLVRRLEQCESPRTCPHGRPTVLHFSVDQLDREFGRR